MTHEFTAQILAILTKQFGDKAQAVFDASPLLQYLNVKTKSANRGSKSRSSFANLYAVYVLVEDYLAKGYGKKPGYKDYEGAKFTVLFKRQRELPFGQKLQNHALNSRLNEEFKKYNPTLDAIPIMRDLQTERYWVNENLLRVKVGKETVSIAEAVIAIINAYVGAKKDAFQSFIADCERMAKLKQEGAKESTAFVAGLVKPNVDARVFEIVSYAVLRAHYGAKSVFWGWTRDELTEEPLVLYKTGRTNANDGGIDFVMRPLGRFFQVTETVDAGKYFLDIDKVQRFPITFVVKSEQSVDALKASIRAQAEGRYSVTKVVDRYMSCVEEVINIPMLLGLFDAVVKAGKLQEVLDEIVRQSKMEFNYEET
ncbi:MAG: restriction endonuclease [Phycisphaerales bacterium]|nr:restriction endonuclease [Phycisphaerales bacterium]